MNLVKFRDEQHVHTQRYRNPKGFPIYCNTSNTLLFQANIKLLVSDFHNLAAELCLIKTQIVFESIISFV